MNGRPCELTQERLDKLVELAKKPISQSAMACAVGVAPRTLSRWLAKGRKKPRTGLEAKLVRGMGKARSTLEQRPTSIILTAAEDPKHWRAAGWLLTKLFPKRWGDRIEVDAGSQGPQSELDPEVLGSEEYIKASAGLVEAYARVSNAKRAAG